MVAEELEEYSEAKANYLQALEYWTEFNDTYSIETYSIPALARLYQTTQDQNLLTMNNEQWTINNEQLIWNLKKNATYTIVVWERL